MIALLRYHVKDGHSVIFVDGDLYVSKDMLSDTSKSVDFETQHSKFKDTSILHE